MISTLRTLFDAVHEQGIDYRTVGITFGRLSSFAPRQLSVFDVEGREHETDARLSDTLSRLRARYGESIVHQGYIDPRKKKQDIGVLFEVG